MQHRGRFRLAPLYDILSLASVVYVGRLQPSRPRAGTGAARGRRSGAGCRQGTGRIRCGSASRTDEGPVAGHISGPRVVGGTSRTHSLRYTAGDRGEPGCPRLCPPPGRASCASGRPRFERPAAPEAVRLWAGRACLAIYSKDNKYLYLRQFPSLGLLWNPSIR
ncbi:hypothetical protein [Rhodobacter sp. NSM]|uniref:hypothetical protein n=1 Tax=Rhodobacter sp. NSM TaxID=3457501 RepID=UPI003FCF6E64